MTKKSEKIEAIKTLRDMLPEGCALFVIERSRSRSGMSGNYSIVTIHGVDCRGPYGKNEPPIGPLFHSFPSRYVATALGWRYVPAGTHSAVRVNGCGTDRAAHLIETLSFVLYGKPDAFKFCSL